MQYHISYSANKEENIESIHEVSFLIEKNHDPKFEEIKHSIMSTKIKFSERNVSIMAACAITTEDDLFKSFDTATCKTDNRDFLFILGVFNAKTASLHNNYPNEIGT